MKKMFFSAIVLLFFNNVLAQDFPNPDYDQLDKQLIDIDITKIKSGILYERTIQLANLYNFNLSDSLNTADYNYFKQSILELYNASKTKKFLHSKTLEEKVDDLNYNSNVVPFGIINTDFEILSDWENSEYRGVKFDSIQQKYIQILGKEPFYTLHTTIIAPLKTAVEGNTIQFVFDNNFLFSFEKPIKSLIASFDNNKTYDVIKDGQFQDGKIEVSYEVSGTKFISFKIIYDDDSGLVTHSSIYVLNRNQPFDLFTSCSNNDTLREDFSLTSALDFTGYKPTDPKIYPKFDYRVYYSSGNTAKKIMKPIIIIDGFDPGDKRKIEDCDCEQDPICAAKNRTKGVFDPEKHRSIVDMMVYYEGNNKIQLLNILREKGYDVMIVNFPKYNTTNLLNGSTVTIDGGAYYIESNAMALVKLLTQTKDELIQNGSSNQIAIIAPSMAGQISRYALSYMEKNDLPHNVYLWVSVDSPHLGANIPIGDQGLIYRLQAASDQAIDFYQKELSSPASQQQLIEFHRQDGNNANPAFQNGQTISQGLLSNSGNSFFQEHYDRQNNNGLPNSLGWPQNLRKISVVNGSLTGSRQTQTITGQSFVNYANDSELVLSIRGFQKIRILGITVGKVHVASLESRFLPKDNTPIKISRFHKTFTDRSVFAGNINSRGNMDNVPGGFFDAQDQLKKSILSNTSDFINFNLIIGTNGYWSLREFNPIHSFIPTFSAIAHLEPNQNWNNPLDDNLVCPTNRKTPFDSYFGISKNTPHTSFTKECVYWLLEELQGHPQLPNYPLDRVLLDGPDIICLYNTDTVYNFDDVCKLPGEVENWQISDNLQITNQSGTSVTIRAIHGVQGTITAVFNNGKTISKHIWINKPYIHNNNNPNPAEIEYNVDPYLTDNEPMTLCLGGDTYENKKTILVSGIDSSSQWEIVKLTQNFSYVRNENVIYINPYNLGQISFKVRVTNSCGVSNWGYYNMTVLDCNDNSYMKTSQTNIYTVYPNPSNNVVYVDLINQNNKPETGAVISGQLYDLMGYFKSNVEIIDNKATFSVQNLSKGIYALKIFINGQMESHLIAVE